MQAGMPLQFQCGDTLSEEYKYYWDWVNYKITTINI